MRGLGRAIAGLLIAAALTGCQRGGSRPVPSEPTGPAPTISMAGTGDAASTSVATGAGLPEFTGALPVEVVTGLRVMGNGCRQTSPRDACTVDGAQTFTWVGTKHLASLTSARMRPDADHGAWVVTIRFARPDRAAVQLVADRAGGMGGYALLLDHHTGNALLAAAPPQVEHGLIRLTDLDKPTAWDLVNTIVTAATRR